MYICITKTDFLIYSYIVRFVCAINSQLIHILFLYSNREQHRHLLGHVARPYATHLRRSTFYIREDAEAVVGRGEALLALQPVVEPEMPVTRFHHQ